MVSLTQLDKARELHRQGYKGVPRRDDAELIFGGPMVMARAEWTFVKIYADGSVHPATEADLKDRYPDPMAVERARYSTLFKKMVEKIESEMTAAATD